MRCSTESMILFLFFFRFSMSNDQLNTLAVIQKTNFMFIFNDKVIFSIKKKKEEEKKNSRKKSIN